MNRTTILATLLAFALPAVAQAAPVKWPLQNDWALGDSQNTIATASGSFAYDADTDAFSDLNLTVVFAPESTSAMSCDVEGIGIIRDNLDSIDVFYLASDLRGMSTRRRGIAGQILSRLTNAGGVVQVSSAAYALRRGPTSLALAIV